MPLYDIKCSQSGEIFERHIPLVKFEEPIICACGAMATRVISTPMFSVDNTDYSCPITGKRISSRGEHRENLERQGCRVLESGETEATTRRREADDAALDKAVEETVEREIYQMPSEKREKLHNELVHGGLDAVVERR